MFDNSNLAEKNGSSATVSVTNWMGLDAIGLLNIIPILGTIVALVLYIVILCGSQTAPSVKNRIIATIAWSVIALVMTGLGFLFCGSSLNDLLEAIQNA